MAGVLFVVIKNIVLFTVLFLVSCQGQDHMTTNLYPPHKNCNRSEGGVSITGRALGRYGLSARSPRPLLCNPRRPPLLAGAAVGAKGRVYYNEGSLESNAQKT